MSRIIDLTVALQDGLRGVSVESARTIERDGWNATTLHLYSHCGTHMDAPLHFGVSEQTIDQIPLERLIGPAWVVDLSGIAPGGPIGVGDVAGAVPDLQAGDGLLLRTDWSRRLRDPSYRNALPRVSLELARWCVERGVRILGVEPPSVADVHNREELTAVHQVLLAGGVVVVEGLAHLDQLRRNKVTFMAFPLKVAGGDGAPVRALAVEE
jgi:arylformamidase